MHMSAIVVVKPAQDMVTEVKNLMAPYDENLEGNNDWWDYWSIGGRFSGDFADDNNFTTVAKAMESEFRPFTLVTNKGAIHQEIWVAQLQKFITDEEFDERYLKWLAACPRDYFAVLVDYHS